MAIDRAWGRIVPGSRTGSVYLRIRNNGEEVDKLISVASAAAERAMLHSTSMANGVASMAAVTAGIAVPAGGSVTLKPGGTHIMLLGTRADLKVGDALPIHLTLERAGAVDITVQILPLGAPDPFPQ
jgi:periplasmic copper chaperone A